MKCYTLICWKTELSSLQRWSEDFYHHATHYLLLITSRARNAIEGGGGCNVAMYVRSFTLLGMVVVPLLLLSLLISAPILKFFDDRHFLPVSASESG